MSQQTATHATDVVVRLAGESGEGVVSLGDLTVQMLSSLGLDIYTFQTFPAKIKGGTVMYQIRVHSGVTLSQGDGVDVLIALSKDGYDSFHMGMREDGILLYDSDAFTPPESPGRTEYGLPISTLANHEKQAIRSEVEGEQLKRLPPPKNIVGLGALMRLISAPLEPAEQYIRDLFGRKGEPIVRMNINALHVGAQHIEDQIGAKRTPHVYPVPVERERLTINGNQMLAIGALAAGCRFYAGYPITPASDIMEFLAKEMPKFGGELIQAEDEIAALGMCLGASFAGKKAMTATSGPGLSLMVEQINLGGQAEIPVVIADIQRGGASTGMPTKTSQGDLNLAVYGVHNESPRIVIAASSVEDCFWTSVDAFNLAEKYQCPVILLSDQALATRKCTIPMPELDKVRLEDRLKPTSEELSNGFRRFEITETGVSPMSIPGMAGGAYVSTGIEHDELSNPGYDPDLAQRMKAKRFLKLETLAKSEGASYYRLWGVKGHAKVGIIAFGSTEGVLRESTERAREEGYKVAHLHCRLINPLPVEAIKEFAARCDKILIPELNWSGQFGHWVRANTNIEYRAFAKDVGLPFAPNEIYNQIIELLAE
ncbi:MAG: 2-oxoacid:acceptor oxidoreductase subunit alpha [Armatimonadetes bacterium]|nr:2-oxoacid:acceptor oxidoreductase subunit alpha [Armatimonadota bacterium]